MSTLSMDAATVWFLFCFYVFMVAVNMYLRVFGDKDKKMESKGQLNLSCCLERQYEPEKMEAEEK